MAPPVLSKASPIIIVGAGVFGLSTAIHLARRGYKDVTILDQQPYEVSRYSYDAGCDAASADYNKVMRAAYGSLKAYQDMGLDAIAEWHLWNSEIKAGQSLPPGFTQDDVVFVNNGSLELNSKEVLTQHQRDSITNMSKAGVGNTQVVLTNPKDVARAVQEGFGFAINPFGRPPEENYGLLDTMAGFVYADKACLFALHKAKTLGVKTILGGTPGTFKQFLRDSTSRVTGVRTANNDCRPADLVIMACGGWTPSLVPQMDNLCETTAGSVSIFQVSTGSPLWHRFAPDNFPTWAYDLKTGRQGGLYGFPRDPNGAVKIGYRGTKFTNPQLQPDGVLRSVPITRWTKNSIRQIPQIGADVISRFVQTFLPELIPCEVKTRLCWYTDSFDNHFVVDFIPELDGVMIASGGSGHGFHFLPILGNHVVDRIEGKSEGLLETWAWRKRRAEQTPINSIMEGLGSERALQTQALTREDSLQAQYNRL
ncbi:uncharacterized protein A1O9_12499 [Exophiala aquamarina CBS 119918]|uniref:FAD dependent oxidoreductase domain-containing protein n=1 Tax=Exophiala aquamarina CBS 119918 TaxID=1182545 RepID=A0A072NVZ7_9EURO|nr:uncharacterized protein A1O9_12499 [Exophiala aquamarina CBS 119918]KEF51582.1 hypothetical protein A1O9_12499 [Exophiala aquamarina CBS 119918]